MSILSNCWSKPRRNGGALLLAGVFAGVTVGGGVGVFAAASPKSVTVCANKTTNILRYSKSDKCSAKESSVVLNQTGTAGEDGTIGKTGAKGDTGKTGAKGDAGVAGPKGDTGATGTIGATGAKGDAGATGENGASGANGTDGVDARFPLIPQAVCDGTDADATANEVCKIGMTGPGGGTVFFADDNNEFAGLDYLEVAPTGWGNGISVAAGETTGTATVDPILKWCHVGTTLGIDGYGKAAVGIGAANTTFADSTCVSGAIQAASDYTGGSKSDWFLPSAGEASLMFMMSKLGIGLFTLSNYWTSSELTESDRGIAFSVSYGVSGVVAKGTSSPVRPIRSF